MLEVLETEEIGFAANLHNSILRLLLIMYKEYPEIEGSVHILSS